MVEKSFNLVNLVNPVQENNAKIDDRRLCEDNLGDFIVAQANRRLFNIVASLMRDGF